MKRSARAWKSYGPESTPGHRMLTHFLGWTFAILTLVMMATNGVLMLFSPKLWFRLPGWIRANARFENGKDSFGFGAVQIRILGGVTLLVLAVFVAALVAGGK